MDDGYIMVSAVSHWAYCPRRCGLIHLEHCFEENEYTVQGSAQHERTDLPITRSENNISVERALPIWSDKKELTGKADVVEFHPDGRIIPVEYKNGPCSHNYPAELQLCAQAVCLEEMFGCSISQAAVYSSSQHQRADVDISQNLRDDLDRAIDSIKQMIDSQNLPDAYNDARCERCSLLHVCLPQTAANRSWTLFAQHLYDPSEYEVYDEP